jgi:hypothetical protein
LPDDDVSAPDPTGEVGITVTVWRLTVPPAVTVLTEVLGLAEVVLLVVVVIVVLASGKVLEVEVLRVVEETADVTVLDVSRVTAEVCSWTQYS